MRRPLVDDLVDGFQDHAVVFERLGYVSQTTQEGDGALEETGELFVGYEVREMGPIRCCQDEHVTELPVRRRNVSSNAAKKQG